MYCTCCGKEYIMESGSMFCSGCGKPQGGELQSPCPPGGTVTACSSGMAVPGQYNPLISQYSPINQGSPAPRHRHNIFAVLGFVFAFVFPLLGLIFSSIGLAQASKFDGEWRGFAIAGLILSIFIGIINIMTMINLLDTI